MKQFKWTKQIITSENDIQDMFNQLKKEQPRVCALDTETTGLHIIHDRPFVYQFGFVQEKLGEGFAYAIDLTKNRLLSKEFILKSLRLATKVQWLIGSNIKFDLHMLKNIGYSYTKHNVTDTTYYIRWGTDNVPPNRGGDLLGIKQFCAKYVYPEAKDYDKLIKVNKTKLKRKLKREVTYEEIDRDMLVAYSLEDIVLTLEGFYKIEPVVKARDNLYAVQIENDLLWVLLDMERVGFKTDKQYLLDSKTKMEQYMEKRKKHLYQLAGQEFSVGQHALIKKILAKKFGVVLKSTGKEVLDVAIKEMNESAVEFIKTIQELRTLEKWYSTYILRFLNELKKTDILYTTINQVGAVSGRVSSDFQQFPKKGIKTIDEEELFTPRKMVKVRGGDYDKLIYLDYSQIELRVQALYTILVKHPDHNLCRAYMPYKCYNKHNQIFDYTNKEHLKNWKEDWYLEEDRSSKWVSTDLHGVTAKYAFNISETDEKFSEYRSIGKRVNFAKNYGASRTQIVKMFPHFNKEQIDKIDGAYYKAYPGVKHYHTYCYNVALSESHVVNLFGVKYYGVSGHNLINMLIQGSSATLLKLKLIQCHNYLKEHGYKTKIQMNIHDEISFEKHKDDPIDLFFKMKEIMEDWEDSYVPIVSDMEISTSTWAAKEVYHGT